jgi:hypothetical protein
MSKNETKAEPAELPDDVDISVGADYELEDPCKPINPQPGFRYFAAANDGDTSRPDGVARCKQMGYEVCTEEKILSTDCVLMRMPLAKWEKQTNARISAARKAALTAGNAIHGVPAKSLWQSDDHSTVRRVGK